MLSRVLLLSEEELFQMVVPFTSPKGLFALVSQILNFFRVIFGYLLRHWILFLKVLLQRAHVDYLQNSEEVG